MKNKINLPNLPELQAELANIIAAIEAGKTPDEIWTELRLRGIVTTLARVETFCRSLASPPQPSPSAQPPPVRFPEFDPVKPVIIALARGGFSLSEIRDALVDHYQIKTTEARLKIYVEQLLNELFPPGPIQRHLFEVTRSDQKWDDEMMVLPFGPENQKNGWTVRDLNEGVCILGGTGSGKSSGSATTLAAEILMRGYGGLVLTTKKGEAVEWMKLASATKRGKDVSIVRHDGPLRLNLLQYEMERPGPGSEFTENIVEFFKNLLSVLSVHKGQVVNQNFWQLTGDQLLRNLVNCFLLGKQPLTLDGLCEFVANAPTKEESAAEDKWPQIPVFGECLSRARDAAGTAEDMRIYQMLEQYWLKAYPRLAPETRSCITIAFSAMLDALRARHIYDMLSTMTTITPESIFDGRIIIVDLPINEFQGAGLLVQAAWKYLFQRAVLRRPDKSWGANCRPVFLWADECQNTMLDFDAEFQSRARDCRVTSVMITQNLNCLYERFGGGDAARVKVDAILGNLSTKFWHANGDPATNKHASELIGTAHISVPGESSVEPSYPGLNPLMDFLYKTFKKPVQTRSKTTVREPIFHPHEFMNLLTGGPRNDYLVTAIATRVGKPFADGNHYAPISFRQPVPPTGK